MSTQDEAARIMLTGVAEQMRAVMCPKVQFKKIRDDAAEPPSYATPGSAGADVQASAELIVPPGGTRLVPTGYAIALPEGYEGQVRPRSGLALRHGITVLNSPGTIDSDYRGELLVMLHNMSNFPYEIKRGDKIAQLVVAKASQVGFVEVDELSETERNTDGFGSTGY